MAMLTLPGSTPASSITTITSSGVSETSQRGCHAFSKKNTGRFQRPRCSKKRSTSRSISSGPARRNSSSILPPFAFPRPYPSAPGGLDGPAGKPVPGTIFAFRRPAGLLLAVVGPDHDHDLGGVARGDALRRLDLGLIGAGQVTRHGLRHRLGSVRVVYRGLGVSASGVAHCDLAVAGGLELPRDYAREPLRPRSVQDGDADIRSARLGRICLIRAVLRDFLLALESGKHLTERRQVHYVVPQAAHDLRLTGHGAHLRV